MSKKTARKKSSNTNSRSSSGTQKKTRLALFVLGILILTVVIGKMFSLALEFYYPKKDSQLNKNYVWDENNIDLLVNKDKNLSLLSFNPTENTLIVLNIPDDTYLEVPQKHGSWMVSSVYNLGQSVKEPLGSRLLVYSVSNFLGIPIDGFLQSELEDLDAQTMVDGLRQNPFSILKYLSLDSNLNKSEKLRLFWGISRVRFDKVTEIDLQTNLTLTSLADRTQVLTADPVRLNTIAANFIENSFKTERLEIAVVNATEIGGLAFKASRLIENIGGDVVITTTSSRKSKNTFLIGSNSKSFDRLSQIFNSDCLNNPQCDKIDVSDLQLEDRVDLILVLGEDFNNRF